MTGRLVSSDRKLLTTRSALASGSYRRNNYLHLQDLKNSIRLELVLIRESRIVIFCALPDVYRLYNRLMPMMRVGKISPTCIYINRPLRFVPEGFKCLGLKFHTSGFRNNCSEVRSFCAM